MMSRLILLGFLVLALTETTGQNIDPDHLKLYSRVLNAFLKQEGVKRKRIVLKRETQIDLDITENTWRDSASRNLIDNLVKLNKDKSSFEPFELKNYGVVIVSQASLDSMFVGHGREGWIDFHNRYSKCGGIVCMSKFYLSSNRTSGLIYIEYASGGLRGAGYLIYFDLLSKEIITKKECLWVS